MIVKEEADVVSQKDLKSAKSKLKLFIKEHELKGIVGVGVIHRNDESVLVVNVLAQSFNKNARALPDVIDSIRVEVKRSAKALLQHYRL